MAAKEHKELKKKIRAIVTAIDAGSHPGRQE
jgi:hypothetical protein